MPISEAMHLDEVAEESAATGEVLYLTRDGRRLAAIVPADAAAQIEAAEMLPMSGWRRIGDSNS
jgi:antitoxin (DNA-binding transcriptional repressor) of toxin-antitoxin stability system